MTSVRRVVLVASALVLAGVPACLPSGGPGPGSTGPMSELPPAGFGTLRQEDISLRLTSGDLRLRITPLEEWVIRLTAPDTYRRLSGLVAGLTPAPTDGQLPVLVSIYTEAAGGALFEPRELELENRGRRFRPVAVRGLTSAWGTGRLSQGVTEQAVYLFGAGVDLEMELRVHFGGVTAGGWSEVLPRLEAERERVRRRSGGGPTPRGRTS